MHARHRCRKNVITKLTHNGQSVFSHGDKATLLLDYYTQILGTVAQRTHALNLADLGVPTHDLSGLDIPFTEDEIWSVIREMPSDKSLGPDGFTGAFFKLAWHVIKKEIIEAINTLSRLDSQGFNFLNSALVTLIPKKEEATEVADYRPISLIHSIGKIFSKLLAKRLAAHLQQLVSQNQSAFIKNRYILDNFNYVRLAAKKLYRTKHKSILLKLDITKAFDTVSWPFLLEVLAHMGFSTRWRDWISMILTNCSSCILLNGVPGLSIVHERGLRQGDPLSPMLFILVMEVLNCLVQKAADVGLLRPLRNQDIKYRASLYADDVILFLNPVEQEMLAVRSILASFAGASGLITNLRKCAITPIRCSEDDIALATSIFPCQVVHFPCRYLGLPLSVKRIPKASVQH